MKNKGGIFLLMKPMLVLVKHIAAKKRNNDPVKSDALAASTAKKQKPGNHLTPSPDSSTPSQTYVGASPALPSHMDVARKCIESVPQEMLQESDAHL